MSITVRHGKKMNDVIGKNRIQKKKRECLVKKMEIFSTNSERNVKKKKGK